jgi:hypothetical protein
VEQAVGRCCNKVACPLRNFRVYALCPDEVEVAAVISGDPLKTFWIENCRDLSRQLDQSLGAELLQHPVDVDRCHPGRIGQLFLSKREWEAVVRRLSNDAVADQHLAHEVRDSLDRLSAPMIDDPFAQND